MKHTALIFALGLFFLTVSAFAQNKAETVRFTSRYTNLDKDCRTIEGGEGQDAAFDCRGVGGYRVYVGYAAAAKMVNVYTPDDELVGNLPMQDFDYDHTKIKVEWRLANGKPFAVIIRFFKYGEERAEETDYFGKKTGEILRVVGLQGFENIDFTVDASAAGANANARELADQAFRLK